MVRGLSLSRDDLARRAVIMGLMCQGQVLFETIEQAFLLDCGDYFEAELALLREHEALGLVRIDDGGDPGHRSRLVRGACDRDGVRPLPAVRPQPRQVLAHPVGPHVVVTLIGAAFLMGLAGGPHCVAMCGAASAGVVRIVRRTDAPQPAVSLPFHAGRVLGYSVAGAVAAQAVQGLGWLAEQTAALRPAWTLLHVAVLAWGLSLLVLGRQPAIAGATGRRLWDHVRPLTARAGGTFTVGALWACMPCGLLYSALLAASLSGGPAAGAASMALFAVGSGLSLALAPKAFGCLRGASGGTRERWGTRAAGAAVVLASAWALWMDLAHRIAIWCGLA